ncbi:conserved hypothetical protein, ribA/ribD-fused [Noviherbaspirillum humi]|uniref:NADAR domain-containing protein n=1 Tax=Noviherbaspirillum humi TaxID=1688639 RepID=A0A239JQ27_9BURK|nr:NADAR family protein [Noviherbaspirillum humi]SNT07642.1 conserved hypothetical protein, ribA/ribD-fused [Noviherbaspirillum humi]
MPQKRSEQRVLHPKGTANFVHDGIRFVGLTQYVYYQQALFLGDYRIAEKILKAKPRDQLRRIRKEAVDTDASAAWEALYPEVLKRGIKAKFAQEPTLCRWLLQQSEGELRKVRSLWDFSAADAEPDRNLDESPGSGNLLGDALAEVRQQLARQH